MKRNLLIILLILSSLQISFSQNYYNEDISVFRVNVQTPQTDTNLVLGVKYNGSSLGYQTEFHTNDNISHISSGDFNGDGISDIALVCDGGTAPQHFNRILIYKSNGSAFVEMTELPIQHLGYDIQGLACGDFNNDGYDDIAFFRSQGDQNPTIINLVYAYISNGSTFSYMTQMTYGDSSFNNITSGDYNNDGYDDIAVSRKYTGGPGTFNDVSVFTSNGSSFSFQTSLPCHQYGYDIIDLTSADFNSDGYDDIAFLRSYGDGNPSLINRIIIFNSNISTFTETKNFTYGFTSMNGLSSGDINGDGRIDIIVTRDYSIGQYNYITVLRNDITYFSYFTQYTFGGYSFLGVAGGRFFGKPNSNYLDNFSLNFQVDGTDYFPIGWYSDPNSGWLPGIAANGMNMVVPYIGEQTNTYINSYLQTARTYSLDVLIQMDPQAVKDVRDGSTDYTPFTNRANQCAIPINTNLLGWYICDEPNNWDINQGGKVYPRILENIDSSIKTVDTDHPTFIAETRYGWTDNDFNSNDRHLSYSCDVAMWDEYPLDSGTVILPNQIKNVSKAAFEVNSIIQKENHIPIIAILQGYGTTSKAGVSNGFNKRDPLPSELRYMTYTSLIHGAKGLIYWAYYRADSTVESRVEDIVEEVKNLNIPDAIMSSSYSSFVKTNNYNDSDDNGIEDINYILRNVGDKKYYLFTVNDYHNSINGVMFSFPSGYNISSVKALHDASDGSDRIISNFSNNFFYDNFTKFQVHLYEIVLNQNLSKQNTMNDEDNNQKNKKNNLVPNAFVLKQNYPNPFNPTTNINYAVKEKGVVQLKIYDVLGTEVANLVNEVQSEGNYSVSFNASDLPSGIYIYSLRVNGFVSSKKMIFLK